MAMHYFHIANGQTNFDSVGTDLPDLQSVRKEALRAGSEMLNLGGVANSFGLANHGGYGSPTSPMVSVERSLSSNLLCGERSCSLPRRVDRQRFGVADVPPNRALYMNCLM
jgi:hypothetical protein